MTDETPERREFSNADLRGVRFSNSDLSGAVMRGVGVDGMEIDSPWLLEGDATLVVNGIDVTSFVDAELDRRFPGRAERRAADPEALQSAWAGLEQTWAGTVARAEAMPDGTVDVSVDGEWSFAQTLRHLVMATDVWLRRAILDAEDPYHPIGQPDASYEEDGRDPSVFSMADPTFEQVLQVRAERMGMVRAFLDGVTADELAAERKNPWAPQYPETTLSCLHTILEEEWEHHRYAVRDLDAIEAGRTD